MNLVCDYYYEFGCDINVLVIMFEYVSMFYIIDWKSCFKVWFGNKNVFFYNILIFFFVLGKVFKCWEL